MSVIAEVNWCFGIDSLEPAAKMRAIGEAAFGGNSRYRLVRVDQQPVTMRKTYLAPDSRWWFAGVLGKCAIELAYGGIKLFCELMNFERRGNMSFHNTYSLLHAPITTNR